MTDCEYLPHPLHYTKHDVICIYLAVSSSLPPCPDDESAPLTDDKCDLAPFGLDEDEDDNDASARDDVASAASIGPQGVFTFIVRNSSLWEQTKGMEPSNDRECRSSKTQKEN